MCEQIPTPDGRVPSEVVDSYWIWAYYQGEMPKSTENTGKWLLFAHQGKDLNELWAKVKAAVESGKLWREAKVSTARPNENSSDPDKGVICVYTHDGLNEVDAMRIRQVLRELGVTWKARRIPPCLNSTLSKSWLRVYTQGKLLSWII